MKKNKNKNITVPKTEIEFGNAIKHGDLITKLSLIIMGLGNFYHKRIIKGLLYLAIEVAYIYYMVASGINNIGRMITLGTKTQEEVFNEELQIYEYIVGDNSMLCLLYGVVTIFLTIFFVFMAVSSLKSAYLAQVNREAGRHNRTFREDLKTLKHEKLHGTLLSLPMAGIFAFTIIPLVFMILIAFTNYDRYHQTPGNLFDWVGLDNFKAMFSNTAQLPLAHTFFPLLAWTLVWAVCATFSCYILGMILALLINRKGTRAKGFWRFTFVLSIAIPQFVSLLTLRSVFNTNGPMNVILRQIGVIGVTESVPFFTDPTLAKIMIIVLNIWIGVPYTMLQTTGILQNIPSELYESAKVDGANAFTIFFKITLPYMLFVTTPYLITSFVGNINNFNVIFLLSGGGPDAIDYYYAGKTDLLVTWLYKLTIVQKDYNLGAVIGILVFVILATLSLLTYRHTGSYKDEEAFQ